MPPLIRYILAILFALCATSAAQYDIEKLSAEVDRVIDLIGRIPTLVELRAFIDDPAPSRRRDLIGQLLGSKGYHSHLSNYWADLLRIMPAPDRLHHPGNFA